MHVLYVFLALGPVEFASAFPSLPGGECKAHDSKDQVWLFSKNFSARHLLNVMRRINLNIGHRHFDQKGYSVRMKEEEFDLKKCGAHILPTTPRSWREAKGAYGHSVKRDIESL